ncbi:putative tRNA sulfurtransferase [bioreactor metagenome]|uniref:Putative tRNA sulfurtransferase n=2 Tax=root TaxID=1 RepID=A0A645IXN6_9ZZZZ
MDIAHSIGTYETSILPYEDCCTIFVPKHPKTKPRLAEIEAHEAVLDIEALVRTSLDQAEVIDL